MEITRSLTIHYDQGPALHRGRPSLCQETEFGDRQREGRGGRNGNSGSGYREFAFSWEGIRGIGRGGCVIGEFSSHINDYTITAKFHDRRSLH